MKFKYIGDEHHEGPESTLFMGKIEFELHGDYVEVDDPELCAKLENNSTFILEGVDIPPRKPKRTGDFKTRASVADEMKKLTEQMALLQAQFEAENPATKTQPAKKRPKKPDSETVNGPRFPGDL